MRDRSVDDLGLVSEWAMFARSADGSTVAIAEPGGSSSDLKRYDVESGAIRLGGTGDPYERPYDLCISRDAAQVTALTGRGAIVLDRDSNVLASIGVPFGAPTDGPRPIGCAYNPVRDELYAATGAIVDSVELPRGYLEPHPNSGLAPRSLAIGEGLLVVPSGPVLVAY